MPKGYWITRVDAADAEKCKACIAADAEPFRDCGARALVRGGRFENPEGECRSCNVVIELLSHEATLDCRKSPACQAAIRLRTGVSTIDLVIAEGFEEPQPA